MEGEYAAICNIIEQSKIKIESIYGSEGKIDYKEIDQHFHSDKYSILVLKNEYTLKQEEKYKLLEIEVKIKYLLNRIEFGKICHQN